MPSTRRHFLFGALAAPLFAQKKRAAPEPPAVVLIVADGLGAWMLGCYGNKEIHTPNIDRLAQTGMRFVNHEICTPAAAPARASLFTGRVPRQMRMADSEAAASFAHEIALSDILSGQGYQCGYVGEWRLGNDVQPQHGFQFWSAMQAGADNVTRKAGEFLDQQSSAKPFFLTIGYRNPHPPFDDLAQKYLEMYAGVKFESFNYEPMARSAANDKEMFGDFLGNLRKVAASTTLLDDQVAAVTAKLRQRGLLDSTLVIFTSDTGLLLGQHGLWGRGSASEPVNMYDQVIETPMIWSWLGRVPPTNTRPELVSSYDLLPTLCEATASPLPQGRNLSGRSYLALALNQKLPKKEPWRAGVFGHYGQTEMARDTRYKLVLRNAGKGPNELFDLSADPREKTNQYENPQYVSVRDRLTAALAAWRRQTS